MALFPLFALSAARLPHFPLLIVDTKIPRVVVLSNKQFIALSPASIQIDCLVFATSSLASVLKHDTLPVVSLLSALGASSICLFQGSTERLCHDDLAVGTLSDVLRSVH